MKTREDVLKDIEKQEGIDLSKPPKPGEHTKHRIRVDHGRAIDDGFVGNHSTAVKVKDPVTGRKGRVYSDSIPVSGLTRTQTVVEWDSNSNSWEVKMHYPDSKHWNQSSQSYE